MKKAILWLLLATVLLTGTMASCVRPGFFDFGSLKYDEYPTDYDPDTDSWLQIHPDDEDVEITWFVNFAYTDYSADLIKKRTGVKVNFQSALTANNEELNTMISGDKLPDVITFNDLSIRVQLAEEGYAYAFDLLAESYAPSMLSRMPAEYKEYYSVSDGHMYSLAQNFYADSDIKEFEEDLGQNQHMNHDIIVRKDYLNAFISHKMAQNPSYNVDTELTKPSGFIEMAKWVKQNYNLSNTIPTVCLSPFLITASNDVFNLSLQSLMEMFCVPYEDAEGNYVYQYDTPEFIDVLEFINEMYNQNLITSENFGWSREAIGTRVMNGEPFAYIGASQQVGGYLAIREKAGYNDATGLAPTHEYVSIILTNEEGDAPLLMDYAGRGSNVTMITKNCKRVDRVIKVFDYLLSEQGQREMYYGENEGEYYTYKVRPGEVNPDTQKVSTYGVMEWTQKAKDIFKTDTLLTAYTEGLTRQTFLTNPLYKRITAGSSNYLGATSLMHYIEYKHKTTYFDYSFSRVPFRYPFNGATQKELNEYIDIQAKVEEVWIEAYPKMIMAANSTAMKAIYDKALADSYAKGAEKWTQFRNKYFKEYKVSLGISYAYPKMDPAYVAPEVKLFGSAEKYKIDKPDFITNK